YYRKLAWAAATFAFFSDLALISLGGTLKRKEKLTGRFADILSWMYLGISTLRRFEAEGHKQEDLPFVHWAMQYGFAQIQQAFEGIFSNLPVPLLGSVLRAPIAGWWRLNPIGTMPCDRLGSQIAHSIQTPGNQRDRLTEGIYSPSTASESLADLERAFLLASQTELILQKIKTASRMGKLPQDKPERLIEAALKVGVITEQEAELTREAEFARYEATQVDAFAIPDLILSAIEQPVRR
ncbi:MAG: DUF1974 domain-containing protein, partial [Microcystaceae cyanobacterium]